MKIDRFREDGEGVRRFFVLAEVRFADRETSPRDEYDRNYYEDRELRSVATDWMRDGVYDRDDSPSVRFHDIPDAWHRELLEHEIRKEGSGG